MLVIDKRFQPNPFAEAYLSEATLGAPHFGRFRALPSNSGPGWKGFLGTNNLTYYFFVNYDSGRLLPLPKNIRLGWKGFLGTNNLAY